MAEVIEFSRWRPFRQCHACEEGEACHCVERDKSRLWRLHGTTGRVQQFLESGSYYGTWEGGRTGAMVDLDACKARVEKAVRHD